MCYTLIRFLLSPSQVSLLFLVNIYTILPFHWWGWCSNCQLFIYFFFQRWLALAHENSIFSAQTSLKEVSKDGQYAHDCTGNIFKVFFLMWKLCKVSVVESIPLDSYFTADLFCVLSSEDTYHFYVTQKCRSAICFLADMRGQQAVHISWYIQVLKW